MHHRKNRSQGGGWCPSNIVALCPGCHKWVTEHPKAAGGEGFHVPGWQDTQEIPILKDRRVWTIIKSTGEEERKRHEHPGPAR